MFTKCINFIGWTRNERHVGSDGTDMSMENTICNKKWNNQKFKTDLKEFDLNRPKKVINVKFVTQ